MKLREKNLPIAGGGGVGNPKHFIRIQGKGLKKNYWLHKYDLI